jgi:hypothetical protein
MWRIGLLTGSALILECARTFAATVIDSAAAGSDIGAAINRALRDAPARMRPDATLAVASGRLIAPLPRPAKARAVTKPVSALAAGEYSVIVTGVDAAGAEIAAGEAVPVQVVAEQVLEVTVPAVDASAQTEAFSVYVGPPGHETLQAQEVAPGATVRFIDPTEFFNRQLGDVPYYANAQGPPVTVRVVVAAYAGDRLMQLGDEQHLRLGAGQSIRVTVPAAAGLSYRVFAATGVTPLRLQRRDVRAGESVVLGDLRDGDLLPSRAQRIEIAPGEYRQATMITIDRPELTLACASPATIRVVHGFDQAAVLINPAILVGAGTGSGSGMGDNVGVHRLRGVTIEGCTWDMSEQVETASAPPPDDIRNYAAMAWATDELTLRGLTLRNNLRGGIGVLSCSDVRIEGNHIERNRGRAQSDDQGRLLPGRGVGNAINVARNAPFSDPIGDARQTRTVIANNIIVGDDAGEMFGIMAAAGGASENTITGNTISRLRGPCIALEGQNARDSGRTTISGNTCTDTGGILSDNASGGLADPEMRGVTITGNTLSANRTAGIAVSSNNTTVVGNVIDGCQLHATTSGCILITPPRPTTPASHGGTRNLLIANNVIALGPTTRARPPVGVYINGPVPITHLSLAHNRIDCERTANSLGVHVSGDVTDLTLHGNDISDCGGDGVLITDFSMANVKTPQRLHASDNTFRNLNRTDHWMDGRHPLGAAFRFLIDGVGNTSAGHRLRNNRVTDEQSPSRLRYGVIFDAERPGAITDVRLEANEWNARTDDVYNGGATDVSGDQR